MRKIAATYIFPVVEPPIKNGILVCDDDGTVLDIQKKGDNFCEEAGVEFYSGILVPGFVNAHCHLELSHLHQKIKEGTGIGGFIGGLNKLRAATAEEQEKAMQIADRKMWAAGIAAVGDISNGTASLSVKKKSKIYYHTFVEAFGFHPSRAEKSFEFARQTFEQFSISGLAASIVPHSPYSVSGELFRQIQQHAIQTKKILSFHNQESKGENQFYVDGTGPIADHLRNNLGIDISHWQPTGSSSLQSVLKFFPKENPLLLVHNTFSEKADIDFLKEKRSHENTWMVLCPNSNAYIENALPPVALFQNEKLNICLGTDSLASNHQLSILSEMTTLQRDNNQLLLDELIAMATLSGACALGVENQFGSFSKGKKPGVNLISAIDFKQMKLKDNSRVKRIL